jgi:hypothetical protein
MNPKFVPLLPTAPASAGQGRALDTAAVSAAFVALPSSAPQPSPHAATCAAKPSITLKRDGDRVTHVQVTCACGQVIEMECSY